MSDPLRESLAPTPDCPSLDALSATPLDPAVRQHLESCAHCRSELALFQEFEAAEPTPAEAADLKWVEAEITRRRASETPSFADRLRAWFTMPHLAMAAAALLVLITAGIYLPRHDGEVTSPGQGTSVWRSGTFAAISPSGDLDRAPAQLRWEAVPGVAKYHVRVLEVDGTELWSDDVNATEIRLPDPLISKMTTGRAFQWDVTAIDTAGRTIGSTLLQSFHIVATSH